MDTALGGTAMRLHIDIDETTGDGGLLRLLPQVLRRPLRALQLRVAILRKRRLLLASERIYPRLQELEAAVMAEPNRLLAGRAFAQCLTDDRCIERALKMFEAARRSGIARLCPVACAEPLAFEDRDTVLPGFGMSVDEAEHIFVAMALRAIFSGKPKLFQNLSAGKLDRSVLPHMRELAMLDTLTLEELHQGFGDSLGEVLMRKDDAWLDALAHLRPFQARALRNLMEARFVEIADWPPQIIAAYAETFDCVEQFRDLGGEALISLTRPEVIAALGKWERRDITKATNLRRKKAGKRRLTGHRFETDIGVIHKLLGPHFAILLERDPKVIEAFGHMVRDLRRDNGSHGSEQTHQLQTFAKRYLAYMTAEGMEALTLSAEPPSEVLTLAEVNGLLEGLWSKPGLGAAFFEGPFKTPEGAKVVHEVVKEIQEMHHRGSLKPGTDLKALIITADLFDRFLAPYLKPKIAVAV